MNIKKSSSRAPYLGSAAIVLAIISGCSSPTTNATSSAEMGSNDVESVSATSSGGTTSTSLSSSASTGASSTTTPIASETEAEEQPPDSETETETQPSASPTRGWTSEEVVLKDGDNYTASMTIEARLIPPTVSVENDAPGRGTLNGFEIVGNAEISNTTQDRINRIGNLQVMGLIKVTPADCERAVKAPTQQQDIDPIKIPGSKLVWCPVATSGPYSLQADLEPGGAAKSLAFSNAAGVSIGNLEEKYIRDLVARFEAADEAYIFYNRGSDRPTYLGKEQFGVRILAASQRLS